MSPHHAGRGGQCVGLVTSGLSSAILGRAGSHTERVTWPESPRLLRGSGRGGGGDRWETSACPAGTGAAAGVARGEGRDSGRRQALAGAEDGTGGQSRFQNQAPEIPSQTPSL